MPTRGIYFYQFWPAIVWFFLLCILVFIPGSDLPEAGWMDRIYIDKIAHVFLFGMLVILFHRPILLSGYLPSGKNRFLIVIGVVGIAWGLAVEFIQKNFVSGRSFDLIDWAADITGILIGMYLQYNWLLRRYSSK